MPDMTITFKGSKFTLREDGSSNLVLKLLGQGIFVHQYSFTHATPKANLFLEKWNLSSIFLVPPQISEGKQKAVQAWKPTAEEERVIIQNQVKVATIHKNYL